MNPNDQTPPPSTKPADQYSPDIDNASNVQGSTAKEDDYFVVKAPEKKPIDNRAVAVVITLTIIGVILLVVVLVFALISSATGLANDYRRLATVQLSKIDKPIKELEPGAILNGRNPDGPGKTINLSKQSLPNLESVLFVGAWSERYVQTERLEESIKTHYQNIGTYENDLSQLVAFDNALTAITQAEPGLTATVDPFNSLTIRSASGSYENYAKTIEDLSAPKQLDEVKKQLVQIYRNKSTIYLDWAVQLEKGNKTHQAQASEALLSESGKALTLTEDEDFTALFTPSYNALTNNQRTLKNQLAN